MISRLERMQSILETALKPASIRLVDSSHKHAGHAGAQPEGETHYDLFIISSAFEGQKRIARHQIVHRLLAEEFHTGLHALTIQARTPEEAA